MAQIVVHHASNSCDLHPGDLIGTGTISAADNHGLGSLLEISRGGKQSITLGYGETRAFFEDGDEVVTAWVKPKLLPTVSFRAQPRAP